MNLSELPFLSHSRVQKEWHIYKKRWFGQNCQIMVFMIFSCPYPISILRWYHVQYTYASPHKFLCIIRIGVSSALFMSIHSLFFFLRPKVSETPRQLHIFWMVRNCPQMKADGAGYDTRISLHHMYTEVLVYLYRYDINVDITDITTIIHDTQTMWLYAIISHMSFM